MKGKLVTPAFLTLALAINGLLWFLALNNRASEKVVAALISSLIAVLLSIFVTIAFSDTKQLRVKFLTLIPIRSTDWSYVHLHLRTVTSSPAMSPFENGQQQIARSADQERRNRRDADPVAASEFYQLILERALFEWMAWNYAGTWKAGREEFETALYRQVGTSTSASPLLTQGSIATRPVAGSPPTRRDASDEELLYSPDDVSKLLGAGLLSKPLPWLGSFVEQPISLPPDTKVTIRHRDAENIWERADVITLTNRFVSVEIQISARPYSRSLGIYQTIEEWWNQRNNYQLSPLAPDVSRDPDAADRPYISLIYCVEGKYKATWWLFGHPQMADHQKWAEGILTLLKRDWSDEEMLSRMRQFVKNEMLLEK